jgi:hypothetical protein
VLRPLRAGASSPQRLGDNPISGARRMGTDFVRNFAAANLDFASVHCWVDLWLYCDEECKLGFLERWVVGHLEAARDTFDKPVLLQEFGKWKPMAVRDRCAPTSMGLWTRCAAPPRVPPRHSASRQLDDYVASRGRFKG